MKWTIAFISLVLFSCELFEKKDDDDKSLRPTAKRTNVLGFRSY